MPKSAILIHPSTPTNMATSFDISARGSWNEEMSVASSLLNNALYFSRQVNCWPSQNIPQLSQTTISNSSTPFRYLNEVSERNCQMNALMCQMIDQVRQK